MVRHAIRYATVRTLCKIAQEKTLEDKGKVLGDLPLIGTIVLNCATPTSITSKVGKGDATNEKSVKEGAFQCNTGKHSVTEGSCTILFENHFTQEMIALELFRGDQ